MSSEIMHNEIIKKILEAVDKNSIEDDAYPKFSGEGYKPYKIDAKNFHKIEPSASNKRIAFVDGGNAEIISSAGFSLSLIRVCYVIYLNNKKIASKKHEFFAFMEAISQNNEICYKASFFGLESKDFLEEISFSSFDRTLMLGINRAEIGSVANAIRRFAELRMAEILSDGSYCDIIVLDGNLQSTLTNENKFLHKLYESCKKNNVVLSALSKTTSLFTDNGNLLSAVLSSISNTRSMHSWFYYPIADIISVNHKAELFFVRLHSKSKHVFRFEIFNVQKANAEETISILASNCIDPIFIGYPYGLIEADRIARITNREKESLKTMFLTKLRDRKIEKYLNSVNAHELLDRIMF